jgi:hypothetical protein
LKFGIVTPEEFRTFFPVLEAWIGQTLAAHASSTRSVASVGFQLLPLYFSAALLQSAKFVVLPRVPFPPLSAMGLARFAELEGQHFGGITYFDTFFVRADCAGDESLYFHELVHVLQWRLLGSERFLTAYADGLERFGYRQSPLEDMAYRAQARFSQGQVFDAERWVAGQMKSRKID